MNQGFLMLLGVVALVCSLQTALAAEVGGVAPDCALSAIGGTQDYSLKQFRGKVLYVDFWSSWCGPCAQSFTFLNELDRDLKGQGLQVIGINLDEAGEDAKSFLEQHPASFHIVTDAAQQCAKDFGVKAMPSSYLVDRKGIIRYVHLGFRPDEAKEFRGLAEQLLAEKP